MADKFNLYGTPDKWNRLPVESTQDVMNPYLFGDDDRDEDWMKSLKADYRKKADDDANAWVKEHSDDFFKEGDERTVLLDDWAKAHHEADDAWIKDPHTLDLKKKAQKAEEYADYAKNKNWYGTAKEQSSLADKYFKDYQDSRETFRNNYKPFKDLDDKVKSSGHPFMDELNGIYDRYENEYRNKVRDKRNEFNTALNGRKIYYGFTGKDKDEKGSFFLENPSDDPNAVKTYKKIGSRKLTGFPNRIYGKTDYEYPDPTQEFEDFAAPDIKFLSNHDGLNIGRRVGSRNRDAD